VANGVGFLYGGAFTVAKEPAMRLPTTTKRLTYRLIALTIFALLLPFACQKQAPPADKTPVQRIVSMAPNFTAMVVALGMGDRLVGCTSYCDRTGVNADAVSIGSAMDANFEKILSLQPDLIIVQRTLNEHMRRLKALGLNLLPLGTDNIADTDEALRAIGAALGQPEQGEAAAQKLADDLATIKRAYAGREEVDALLVIGHAPGELRDLRVASRGTFLDEILTVAGGRNALADAPTQYPQISKEQLLARDPSAIFVFQPQREYSAQATNEELAVWRALPMLRAVREGRVYVLTDFLVLSPGPNLALTAGALASALHAKRGQP
jgi:ABC-type Fe3+-hydroxamate transport system substrate-binding protein